MTFHEFKSYCSEEISKLQSAYASINHVIESMRDLSTKKITSKEEVAEVKNSFDALKANLRAHHKTFIILADALIKSLHDYKNRNDLKLIEVVKGSGVKFRIQGDTLTKEARVLATINVDDLNSLDSAFDSVRVVEKEETISESEVKKSVEIEDAVLLEKKEMEAFVSQQFHLVAVEEHKLFELYEKYKGVATKFIPLYQLGSERLREQIPRQYWH
jgi:hypothetical protein